MCKGPAAGRHASFGCRLGWLERSGEVVRELSGQTSLNFGPWFKEGALPHLGMGTSGGLGAEGHTQFVCHVGTKLGEGEEQKADEVVTPVIP